MTVSIICKKGFWVMDEQKILWALKVPDAGMAMCAWLNQTYPGLWGSVRFEHVDASG